MKKLIFLKQEYLDIKKLNKLQEVDARLVLFNNSFSDFKQQLKELLSNKTIKIIKQLAEREAIMIDFSDDQYDAVYKNLRGAAVVDLIDNVMAND